MAKHNHDKSKQTGRLKKKIDKKAIIMKGTVNISTMDYGIMDPNTSTLDLDPPEFWPNLDLDPWYGNRYVIKFHSWAQLPLIR